VRAKAGEAKRNGHFSRLQVIIPQTNGVFLSWLRRILRFFSMEKSFCDEEKYIFFKENKFFYRIKCLPRLQQTTS